MNISIFLIIASATIVLFIGLLPSYQVEALSFGGIKNKTTDVLKLGAQAGEGIIKKVPDLIPTPENIYNVGKQTLIGLPFELLISGIDKLCKFCCLFKYTFCHINFQYNFPFTGSIALSANNATESYIQPKISEMNYVLITESENISIPINDSIKLWAHEKFNPQAKVVILVTGWTTDINETNSAADVLYDAYKTRNVNFVLIDTARYVDTLYAWSAFNTQELGEGLGKGLAELISFVPLENIHLMGHSLGAHISSAAGRTFQMETNQLLPRITGFDPAKPCFREGESLQGLSRGDADFVGNKYRNNSIMVS